MVSMETLKTQENFNLIYTKGNKVYTKYTIIFSLKSNETKFGFVTSKKVGNAVKRNRLRRIFREVVYRNSQFFDKQKSYIIVAKKNCLDDYNKLNYEILKKDILKGLKSYGKNSTNKNNKDISKNIKK